MAPKHALGASLVILAALCASAGEPATEGASTESKTYLATLEIRKTDNLRESRQLRTTSAILTVARATDADGNVVFRSGVGPVGDPSSSDKCDYGALSRFATRSEVALTPAQTGTTEVKVMHTGHRIRYRVAGAALSGVELMPLIDDALDYAFYFSPQLLKRLARETEVLQRARMCPRIEYWPSELAAEVVFIYTGLASTTFNGSNALTCSVRFKTVFDDSFLRRLPQAPETPSPYRMELSYEGQGEFTVSPGDGAVLRFVGTLVIERKDWEARGGTYKRNTVQTRRLSYTLLSEEVSKQTADIRRSTEQAIAGQRRTFPDPGKAAGRGQESPKQRRFFACPMHQHVRMLREGQCPICGMRLVPMERGE